MLSKTSLSTCNLTEVAGRFPVLQTTRSYIIATFPAELVDIYAETIGLLADSQKRRVKYTEMLEIIAETILIIVLGSFSESIND